MDISFKNRKLKELLNSKEKIDRYYDKIQAKKIKMRLSILHSAPTLADVPHTLPTRRHQLKGNRKRQFAVDLKYPYRLIFKPNNMPIPLNKDGGIDLKKVTAIKILSIEDYH